jgi:hypothetical protein
MPIVRDLEGWQQAVLEHRRALLEKLLAEFPTVLKTHRTKVDMLRIKLSGPRANQSRDGSGL